MNRGIRAICSLEAVMLEPDAASEESNAGYPMS